ncbi:c-type cytochrome [Cobetia crustatorum]|uniref:Cytochrome c n=1 Tax=Cobetia crustatorum TaxID=553385 RepID=A0A558HKS3_9GAMM|nr:cytochrome c [Cobetia crustatorum]TVU69727.1 cytochrome c [Cobetia crustatorum]
MTDLMTRRFPYLPLASTLLLAGLLLSTAASADSAEDAIQYRQSVFHTLAWQFSPMGAMAKGKQDYDATEFQTRAERLALLAQLPWEGFIEGSYDGDTDALSKISTDKTGFEKHAQALMDESQTLSEVAATQDFAKIREQFAATAKACKSCHQQYRAD